MNSAEAEFQAAVEQNLRRNYIVILLHGVLGQTGMRLINTPTFIPAYIHLLSGSDFVVGLARSLQYFGMFLTPLLGARLVESRRRVLPLALAEVDVHARLSAEREFALARLGEVVAKHADHLYSEPPSTAGAAGRNRSSGPRGPPNRHPESSRQPRAAGPGSPRQLG